MDQCSMSYLHDFVILWIHVPFSEWPASLVYVTLHTATTPYKLLSSFARGLFFTSLTSLTHWLTVLLFLSSKCTVTKTKSLHICVRIMRFFPRMLCIFYSQIKGWCHRRLNGTDMQSQHSGSWSRMFMGSLPDKTTKNFNSKNIECIYK